MPKSINEVTIGGHLGRDPEIKYTKTGKGLAKFSIATGGGKSKDGQKTYPTEWHNIICWIDSVPGATELQKGQYAIVRGILKYSEWTTATGEKRRNAEITAQEIEVEPPKSGTDPAPEPHYRANSEITDEDIPF